jgi:hypothetical protein
MSLRRTPTHTLPILGTNRANADKSTRPRTPEGKTLVALGTLRRGLQAPGFLSALGRSGRASEKLRVVLKRKPECFRKHKGNENMIERSPIGMPFSQGAAPLGAAHQPRCPLPGRANKCRLPPTPTGCRSPLEDSAVIGTGSREKPGLSQETDLRRDPEAGPAAPRKSGDAESVAKRR